MLSRTNTSHLPFYEIDQIGLAVELCNPADRRLATCSAGAKSNMAQLWPSGDARFPFVHRSSHSARKTITNLNRNTAFFFFFETEKETENHRIDD